MHLGQFHCLGLLLLRNCFSFRFLHRKLFPPVNPNHLICVQLVHHAHLGHVITQISVQRNGIVRYLVLLFLSSLLTLVIVTALLPRRLHLLVLLGTLLVRPSALLLPIAVLYLTLHDQQTAVLHRRPSLGDLAQAGRRIGQLQRFLLATGTLNVVHVRHLGRPRIAPALPRPKTVATTALTTAAGLPEPGLDRCCVFAVSAQRTVGGRSGRGGQLRIGH
uniref:(northern house mosquito) hypothetical protein n=1 Tax=Culex pipiens TaxID=7175 RepID=A0A8D8K5V1_CULPI